MKNKEIMKRIKSWLNCWLIQKIRSIFLLKATDIIESKHQNNIQEENTMLYTLNDIPLMNFAMCIKGELEYLHKDKKLVPESKVRYLDIYFSYIEMVGGVGEWKQLQKEYADIMMREIIIKTAILFIEKNRFYGSELEKVVIMYGIMLNKGVEIRMLESELTNVLMSIDSITKRINNYNKANKTNTDILSTVTEIGKAVGYHIPLSILLIEYINYIKSLQNERTNRPNNKRRGV